MKIISLLVVAAAGEPTHGLSHPERNDAATFSMRSIRDAVNSQHLNTWKAATYSRFENASVASIKRILGAVLPSDVAYLAPSHRRVFDHSKEEPLSDAFDSRFANPECADIIGHVRDQSNCGSCWYALVHLTLNCC